MIKMKTEKLPKNVSKTIAFIQFSDWSMMHEIKSIRDDLFCNLKKSAYAHSIINSA